MKDIVERLYDLNERFIFQGGSEFARSIADEIERLRDENAKLREDQDECDALRSKMADILTRTANALRGDPDPLHLHSWHDLPERVTEEVRKLRAELDEQCRLLGMGSEREARLMAQLAESQAREAQLREALIDTTAHLSAATSAYEKFVGRVGRKGHMDALFSTRYSDFLKSTKRGQKTLALPTDDTALKARLKAERERIAEYVDRNLMSAREYVDAIRNLGDE